MVADRKSRDPKRDPAPPRRGREVCDLRGVRAADIATHLHRTQDQRSPLGVQVSAMR